MERLRIGIAQIGANSPGCETVLKAFSDPVMLELCTPIIYGSSDEMNASRKSLEVQILLANVPSASDASSDKVNIVDCCEDDAPAESEDAAAENTSVPAVTPFEKAVVECSDGQSDVLVTMPQDMQSSEQDDSGFVGHLDSLERVLSEEGQGLKMFVAAGLRVASATPDIPLDDVPAILTREYLKEKILTLNNALKVDFNIEGPRIAVLAYNPIDGSEQHGGKEEMDIIKPAVDDSVAAGVVCYGPYTAEYLMDEGNFTHFDAILGMYNAQTVGFFKSMAQDEGVIFLAGLSVICTTPIPGMGYDKVGLEDCAPETSVRHAIYLATDVFRNREAYKVASANKLRKQYNDRRDDSDRLKQMRVAEDE